MVAMPIHEPSPDAPTGRHSQSGRLGATAPFDFGQTLAFLRGFAFAHHDQVIETGSITRAIAVDGAPIVFRVEAAAGSPPAVAYTLWSAEPLDQATTAIVEDRLRFHLSLTDDLAPFYALAADDPAFGPIVEQLHGYHQVKFLTPFECACWSILSQRTPMALAGKQKQRLIEAYGQTLWVDNRQYFAFPEPKDIDSAPPDELHGVVQHSRKTHYLLSVANAFATADEAWLRAAPATEVNDWLRRIDGIGAWSATFIMVRGLGRVERCPVDERRLNEGIARVYGLIGQPDAAALRDLADRYGEWQGYWAHYLRAADLSYLMGSP